jgi:hypothetical protein
MAGNDWQKRNKMTFSAWVKPKQARTRLLNYMVGCGANIITCFRAKPKMKIQKGKDPVELGFMPIGGEEFVYEQGLQCLLYPSSGGVPTWKPELPGEKMVTKLPIQFADLFKDSKPLSEDIGQALAEWAAGGAPKTAEPNPEEDAEAMALIDAIETVETLDDLKSLADSNKGRAWSKSNREGIRAAIQARTAALKAAAA